MTPPPPPLPRAIVDTHHHLWHLGEGCYPWLQDAYDPAAFLLGDYAPLCQDFGAAAYQGSAAGLPVVATVHVEAERDRREALAETRWLDAQHRAHGLPAAIVAWADLLAPDAAEQLAAHAAITPLLRGIRFKPVTARGPGEQADGPGTLRDPRWSQALETLAAHDLCWDLRVPFWHLAEAADLLGEAPAVRVVLEHAGLPWDRSAAGLAAWRQGMRALARHPQVQVKLSEFGLRDQPWDSTANARIVAEVVDIFGWQRCLFGSNFPVASLRVDYLTLVRTVQQGLAHLTPAQQHAVWHDNALACYRIARP